MGFSYNFGRFWYRLLCWIKVEIYMKFGFPRPIPKYTRDHKHPLCEICNKEIEVGDSVYSCDCCNTIYHQKCFNKIQAKKDLTQGV